mmetsp:Transcript_19610/g.45660  ORF Transcript_19610/g.45660 Transcript_19610/m.45660 type:complete len:189 (+) Transcript_19610:286-852(+)
MINVTYAGDTLIATKVTGDQNVPRGEVSFTADLSPEAVIRNNRKLEPIELSSGSAAKWGVDKVERFPGSGRQAARPDHVDGQLFVFGEDHFSFLWVPMRQHVFFGRPSDEMVLEMLRDVLVPPREPEVTDSWHHEEESSIFESEIEAVMKPSFRRPDSTSGFFSSFLDLNSWKSHVDGILQGAEEKTA